MSPLWRNRLSIAISPERISLLKLGRGLKPKLLGSLDEAISVSGQAPWQAVLERLDELLADPQWQAAEADIVLSSRLVQYATVKLNGALKSYPEQEGFARHVLTQTYGPAAGQWELRIQRGKENTPWLVSAVDQGLLQGLRRICANRKLRLRSLTPHLMLAFNRFRKTLAADPAWLVLSEPGHALFVLLNKGEFAAINGVAHFNLADLPKQLDRENLICGLPEPCRTVYLHAPSVKEAPEMLAAGYQLNKLETVMPESIPLAEEGLYALALGVL